MRTHISHPPLERGTHVRSTLLHPQQVSERNAVIIFNIVRLVAALALIVVVAIALL